MKALIWAIHLPDYPELSVEIKIGDRYKPDVVALDQNQQPIFWGEAGQVSGRKLHSLFKRYPQTHFAIGKWNQRIDPHREIVLKAMKGVKRTAPCDLFTFPQDSARFVDEWGQVEIERTDLLWTRIEPE